MSKINILGCLGGIIKYLTLDLGPDGDLRVLRSRQQALC